MGSFFSGRKLIGFIVAPLIALYIIAFVSLDSHHPQTSYALAVAILMAVWWITEVVPLAVTSLLPVALFPLFGILDAQQVASTYFNDVIFLFMGGFLVALAMQRWNLHQRIALRILCITGVSPARILLGFRLASAFLSMWISNTATAMMMLPIAISLIHQLEKTMEPEGMKRFSIGILLGIAYSSSIGGMATLVGTPPNLSFLRIYHIYFPDAPPISFAQWMLFALPFSMLFFLITWIFLLMLFRPAKSQWVSLRRDTFKIQLHHLGKPAYEEKMVLYVFVLLALLWLLRADIDFGAVRFIGWASLFPYGNLIKDGTIAVFMAILLFIIPAKNKSGSALLNWKTASGLPWHILLLFGGGFALASGIKESGLSLWFGEQLCWVADYHPVIIIATIAFMMTFLTELTSNTATTEMILPILAGVAVTTQINPLFLMIPATMSASMAFMLPVATPPNAIVFGSSRVSVRQMARTGLFLNFIGMILISLMIYFWGPLLFGSFHSL